MIPETKAEEQPGDAGNPNRGGCFEGFNLRPGMIDSHFHYLHLENKGLPAEAILDRCFREGLSAALDIGIVPGTFERRGRLPGRFPRLYLASGLYPSECENPQWRDHLPILGAHLRTAPHIAALGEIGLDFFHNYGTPADQRELMEAQMALAAELDLPVVIHCREAEKEILEVLSAFKLSRGGIMHCFSSGPEWTAPFLDLGFYISFAGNVTYKKSGFLRESAAAVPPDRLLAETDAPYLSPQPLRGKLNHPGFIGHTYQVLADARGEALAELIEQIKGNFAAFLSLTQRSAE